MMGPPPFYPHLLCAFCDGWGVLLFLYCEDKDVVILMCDECDTVWLDPEAIHEHNCIHINWPDQYVPEADCSIRHTHWATREELAALGWDKYIPE